MSANSKTAGHAHQRTGGAGWAGSPPDNKINIPYDDDCIIDWLRSVTILHRGHWNAARRYERINFGLGLATAISAAIAGTTAFTQLQESDTSGGITNWIQIGVGVFAFIAAVLGAVQTFVRPSEMAATHKRAAQKYGKLRREMELNLSLGLPVEQDKREKQFKAFQAEWDATDEESIPLPKVIYDKEKRDYKSAIHQPINAYEN